MPSMGKTLSSPFGHAGSKLLKILTLGTSICRIPPSPPDSHQRCEAFSAHQRMPRNFRNIECLPSALLASNPPPLTWLLGFRLVILRMRLSKSILMFEKRITGSNLYCPALSLVHRRIFSERRDCLDLLATLTISFQHGCPQSFFSPHDFLGLNRNLLAHLLSSSFPACRCAKGNPVKTLPGPSLSIKPTCCAFQSQ